MSLIEICASEIEPKPMTAKMPCPVCGAHTRAYGGFGSAPEWRNVGKFTCCITWYGNPETGQHYERDSRGRLRQR